MFVPVGEEEEQALHLDASASGEQRRKQLGSEIGQSLHKSICLLKAFAAWQFIKEFEYCALGARDGQRPVRLTIRQSAEVVWQFGGSPRLQRMREIGKRQERLAVVIRKRHIKRK